jgi:ribonuclease HI
MLEQCDTDSLDKWLVNHRKLNADRWQLHGYDFPSVHGMANWTFTKLPKPSYNHANYPSILPHLNQVCDHWEDLLKAGKIEYFNDTIHGDLSNFVNTINPIHVVLKPDGSIRPLVDPTKTGVNDCMAPLPIKLTTIEEAMQHVRHRSFFAKRDIKHGFHHVVLAPTARRYMGFRHPTTGRIGRWVVLPFGASLSPYIFCQLTNAARDIFQKLLDERNIPVRVLVYVDDFLFIAPTHAALVEALQITNDEGEALGISWNLRKDIGFDKPIQQIDFLGLTIDSISMHLYIPDDKLADYLNVLRDFKNKYATSAPRKVLEKLVGRLCFASRACRWGHVFLQNIFDTMYNDPRRRSDCQLTTAFWEDFEFWFNLLDNPASPWHGRHAIVTSHSSFIIDDALEPIYTNASSWGAGAVWYQSGVFTEFQSEWSADISSLHSGKRELLAVLEALSCWAMDLKHRRILLYSDNMEVVSAINKGLSRIPFTRKFIKKLAEMAIAHGFEIRASHVPGSQNAHADALSRRLFLAIDQDYSFLYFNKFATGIYKPSVDCCCSNSGWNVQTGCLEFYCPANSVLGNVNNLVGKVLWANPPFAIAGEVLDTIYQAWLQNPSSTRATVLVPEWKNAKWYIKYFSKRRPLFRIVFRYPSLSIIFRQRDGAIAGPCPHAILICRLP